MLTQPYFSAAADGGGGGMGAIVASTNTNNINEELDNLMDISIEIASNKRMKKDNIKPFSLTFKDQELEKKVGGARGGSQISCMFLDPVCEV